MKENWDNRYNTSEYVYGLEPNLFFKEQIDLLKPGKILLPADGEGRNSVYAAWKGWETFAFDFSTEARKKAIQLASTKNVIIDYEILSLENYTVCQDTFDLIALIFVHMPSELRNKVHEELCNGLKKNGILIMEAFSKEHSNFQENNPDVGGPKVQDMLFSIEDIKSDFRSLNIISLEQRTIILNESRFHNGEGNVIRLVAQKI